MGCMQGDSGIRLVLLKNALVAERAWIGVRGDQRGRREATEGRRQGKLGAANDGW